MPDNRFFEQQELRKKQSQTALNQEHLKAQQAAFVRAAAHAEPMDRFGQVLKEGDLVVYRPPIDNVFHIDKITKTSALDPKAPPGVVTLILSVQMPVHAQALQYIQNMIRVGHAGSAEQADEALAEGNAPEVTIERVAEPEAEEPTLIISE